jgi:hypothetical protein
MGLWETIISFFTRPPSGYPKSVGKISGDEVFNIIKASAGLTSNIYISDATFDVSTIEDCKAYSATFKHQPYLAEGHDCDNFSFAEMGYYSQGLWSLPFGIFWSSTHAFNFFIDDQKRLWIVEPQTNEYMTVATAKTKANYFPLRLALC